MATCLSLKLPAVGQICLLSLPYKVIANVRQASYCMLVKTEGCSRAGYHGCKTSSYFIINFINFFFLFLFICLFIFLAQSIMKLKQCCTVFRYKIVCVFCLYLLWRKKTELVRTGFALPHKHFQLFEHRWPKRNMRVCMGKIEFET